MPGEFADRLLRVAEEQAQATGRLAIIQAQNVENTTEIRGALTAHAAILEKIAETLERIERDQREGRERAVAFLKERIEGAVPKVNPLIGWILTGSAAVGSAALAALAALRSVGHKSD